MKIGFNIKIDVTKLDKARFFKGKKGTYADLTCFIDTDTVSEYGDNGTVSQAITSEERNNGLKLPILGNAKVFYTDSGNKQQQPSRTKEPPPDYDSSEIPF